jgi:hypothetical protein
VGGLGLRVGMMQGTYTRHSRYIDTFVQCEENDAECVASIDLAMLVSDEHCVLLRIKHSHAYTVAWHHYTKCAYPVCD